MMCPKCHQPMIVVEHQKIELDHCPKCSGVWFDAGELELLVEKAGREGSHLSLAEVLPAPEASTAEEKRKCPICRKKMKKVNIAGQPPVLIDACKRGDGLWFDGGELHQVIQQCAEKSCAASGSQKSIIDFIGETFKFSAKPE